MQQRCIDISIRYRQIRQSVRFVLVFFSNQNIHIFIFVTKRLRSQDSIVIRFRSIEYISEGDAQIKQRKFYSAAKKHIHSLTHTHTHTQSTHTSDCKNRKHRIREKRRAERKVIKNFKVKNIIKCFIENIEINFQLCCINYGKGVCAIITLKNIYVYFLVFSAPCKELSTWPESTLTLAMNDALCILKCIQCLL